MELCFTKKTIKCRVDAVPCDPANVYSDAAGILLATPKNISFTRINGEVVRPLKKPSYYFDWEGISHITVEGVHEPQIGAYFSPRSKSPDLYHQVSTVNQEFTKLDNLTMLNMNHKLFNTSADERFLKNHLVEQVKTLEEMAKKVEKTVDPSKQGNFNIMVIVSLVLTIVLYVGLFLHVVIGKKRQKQGYTSLPPPMIAPGLRGGDGVISGDEIFPKDIEIV